MKVYKYFISIGFGLAGVLSQEPLHIWPLGILFIGFLFYTWKKYCETNTKYFLKSFILSWIIYAGGVCNWISYFTFFALSGFLILQALFAYAFIKITSKIYYKSLPVILFSIFFCSFEFLLAHLPILSFTWLNIATIPIDINFLYNFLRSGGGELLTFIFILVSAGITKYFVNKIKGDLKFKQILISTLLSIFIISTFSLGFIGNKVGTARYSISVVQGNDINRYLTQDEINDNYLRKSHIKLAQQIDTTPDLIIFPESSFNEDPSDKENGLLRDLTPIASKAKSMLIFNTITENKTNYYNTNLFYSPEMKYLGSYSKKRLVPFGEYVPLKNLWGSWSLFSDIGSGFTPGRKDMTINGVSSLICFESAFSDDFRNAITSSTKLMIITTNNRSYRRSGNSEQHLAQSKLRAIEYSIPVVHASVSGKSALIGKDGEIIAESKLFVNQLIEGSLDTTISRSFYANTFDWFSYLCLVVVLCLIAIRTKDLIWKKAT